ncbi:MAG: hypothetical protein K1X72_04410 [Pyrinomonadaceae bacterium]|nr:hypothetical protein [Pyrinomonadaceae bacterium]
MKGKTHQHFELAPGCMVKGDPNMSAETKAALLKMFESAIEQLKKFGTKNPKPRKRIK